MELEKWLFHPGFSMEENDYLPQKHHPWDERYIHLKIWLILFVTVDK